MAKQDVIKKYVDQSIIDLDALEQWQSAAIVLLASKREHKMSYEEISEELGISTVTLYRFRQRTDVKDYILRFNMARIIDRLPEMMEAQMESAISNRSTKAAELILKYAGLLVERRSVDADIKTDVREVSDQSNDDLKRELEALRVKIDS